MRLDGAAGAIREGEVADYRRWSVLPAAHGCSPVLLSPVMARGRPLDFNPQAFTAVRAIIDAAHPFTFQLGALEVHVTPEKMAPLPWPSKGVEGLTPERDGPWPTPVRLRCSWKTGSAVLVLKASYWRAKGQYWHLVGTAIRVEETNRELVWITIPLRLRAAAEDGKKEAVLVASLAQYSYAADATKETKRTRQMAIREAAEAVGLEFTTKLQVDAGHVDVDSGALIPDPPQVFRRLVMLSIVKLPFFLRAGEGGIEGEPPVDVPSQARIAPEGPEDVDETGSGKRLGLSPLPGGVRQYKQTIDFLLAEIERSIRTADALNALLAERFEVTGETARGVYLSLLTNLGLVARSENRLELAPEGASYLRTKDPKVLFEHMHRGWAGMLETLVIADELDGADAKRTSPVLQRVLGVEWKTSNQVSFRRNWLLSLGLTTRSANGDVPTDEGQAVLAAHAEEVAAIRDRVADAVEELGTELEDAVDEEPDDRMAPEVQPGLDQPAEPPADGLSGWNADRIDLDASMILPFVEDLVLPPGTLERVAAALSSDRHLLLVGPPGTAKTELAVRLVQAARAEEYCSGAFVATASADWTTFDTIGGYALQSDSSLKFRSGALLRALEARQWLVIDELNRADVDRAFGELMTVLSGRSTDTSYELPDGRTVRVGPDPKASHPMPKTFRIIATMNTWDKTSLFRLSYALQRRFAIVTIGPPDDASFAALVQRAATQELRDAPLGEEATLELCRLFSKAGLLGVREIGPAIAMDVVRYVRRRVATATSLPWSDAAAEALPMFVFPQLEGLDEGAARAALGVVQDIVARQASAGARSELRQRFADVFPHVRLGNAPE